MVILQYHEWSSRGGEGGIGVGWLVQAYECGWGRLVSDGEGGEGRLVGERGEREGE